MPDPSLDLIRGVPLFAEADESFLQRLAGEIQILREAAAHAPVGRVGFPTRFEDGRLHGEGGGVGYLLGLLFIGAGAGRIYLLRRRR